MADHQLKFSIGSTFTGEGFKQAREAVNSTKQAMNQSAEMAGKLSNAIGGMDASAARAMTAVTSLIQTFLSFNVAAIATQVAVLALSKVVDEYNKKTEELNKRAEETRRAANDLWATTLTERMEAVRVKAQEIEYAYSSVTSQVNALTAALNGLAVAQNEGGIAHLQVQKLQEMIDAHTEAERQAIEQSYNLKIAIEQSANSAMEWQLKMDAAEQAVIDAKEKKAMLDEQLVTVAKERAVLEESYERTKNENQDIAKQTLEKLNKLKAQEADLTEKSFNMYTEIQVALEKEKMVKEQANTAAEKATAAILQVELANQKSAEALAAKTAADEAAKAEQELNTAALEADRKTTEEIKDFKQEQLAIQKQLNEASQALAKAEADYAAAIQDYAANKAFTINFDMSGSMKNGLLPVDVQKGISLTVADKQVDDAVRSGVINTVKDADRLKRDSERETRDKISEGSGQRKIEAERYKNLMEQCNGDVTKLEGYNRNFAETYQKILNAQDAIKQKTEDSKSTLDEQLNNLKDIKSKLDSLGLK